MSAMKTKYTCQGDSLDISCSASEELKIFKATYLREENKKICTGRRMNNVNTAEYCAPDDKTNLLKEHCEGHSECNVTVDTNTMGDKCQWMSNPKDLNVKYGCEDVSSTNEPSFTTEKKYTTVIATTSSEEWYRSGYEIYNTGYSNQISHEMIYLLFTVNVWFRLL
ncbi:adhesion G protein-coupled receptor L2-like [Stylophora pistillata]|uniref:adhesion G protein-coupled receptor L2-like n=1 Tax=Stylophora pistillata TaxID=50429 RepID=UPI000C048C30|nr:adhesion G protein-coupled receptor L2-like [Stylophora pistillata]